MRSGRKDVSPQSLGLKNKFISLLAYKTDKISPIYAASHFRTTNTFTLTAIEISVQTPNYST
jgi:hypothetical protein